MTLFDTFRHVVSACDELKLYHSFDDSHIFLKLIIKMRCFYLIEFRATRVLFHVFLIDQVQTIIFAHPFRIRLFYFLNLEPHFVYSGFDEVSKFAKFIFLNKQS